MIANVNRLFQRFIFRGISKRNFKKVGYFATLSGTGGVYYITLKTEEKRNVFSQIQSYGRFFRYATSHTVM